LEKTMSGRSHNPRFGQRGVFKQPSAIAPVNMKLSRAAVAHRRKNARTAKGAIPIAADDKMQFSVRPAELVFRRRKDVTMPVDTYTHVIATTDGVAPGDFDKEYEYAGVAIKGANYERSDDAEIAVQLFGKSQQLNTGEAPIKAGDYVEYKAMDAHEAKRFHDRFGTTRTMPKLQKAQINIQKKFVDALQENGVAVPNNFASREKLAAAAMEQLRRDNARIIGYAISSADDGASFDMVQCTH
jgi:hypothetical protein